MEKLGSSSRFFFTSNGLCWCVWKVWVSLNSGWCRNEEISAKTCIVFCCSNPVLSIHLSIKYKTTFSKVGLHYFWYGSCFLGKHGSCYFSFPLRTPDNPDSIYWISGSLNLLYSTLLYMLYVLVFIKTKNRFHLATSSSDESDLEHTTSNLGGELDYIWNNAWNHFRAGLLLLFPTASGCCFRIVLLLGFFRDCATSTTYLECEQSLNPSCVVFCRLYQWSKIKNTPKKKKRLLMSVFLFQQKKMFHLVSSSFRYRIPQQHLE